MHCKAVYYYQVIYLLFMIFCLTSACPARLCFNAVNVSFLWFNKLETAPVSELILVLWILTSDVDSNLCKNLFACMRSPYLNWWWKNKLDHKVSCMSTISFCFIMSFSKNSWRSLSVTTFTISAFVIILNKLLLNFIYKP